MQANYNLVIPTITALCAHIGVSDSAVGFVIGCCDIATIFGTLGGLLMLPLSCGCMFHWQVGIASSALNLLVMWCAAKFKQAICLCLYSSRQCSSCRLQHLDEY